MKIVVEFESTREATAFMEKFLIDEKSKKKIEAVVPVVAAPKVVAPIVTPVAPVVTPVTPVAPVVTPVAPVVTPVAPVVTPVATPVTPVAPVVTPVAPVERVYTELDMRNAAISLVDGGRSDELVNLLGTFKLNSLNELPPEYYPAFAAHLRSLGCQI